MSRGKKNISTYIYGFDIETSTIKDKDGDYVSFMYVGTFGQLDVATGNIEKYSVIRTWKEFDNVLNEINRYSEQNNVISLIYVHNNYEWSFIKNNSIFFKDEFKIGAYSALFKSSTKPLTVRVKNIELRDSLLLLNKSIAVLGDELGYKKLPYLYETVRYPSSKLSDYDLEYNWRDVEIQLRALYKLYKTEPYIESPKDLPLTQTGRTRKNNRWDKRIVNSGTDGKNVLNSWDSKCRREFPKSLQELEQEINTSKGGYVHANAYFVGKVMENVHSFDLSSAHPSQTLNRLFPAELPALADNPNKKFDEIINRIFSTYRMSAKYSHEPLELYLLSHDDWTRVGWHAIMTLADVDCKIKEKNYMPTISVSKCTDIVKPLIDNGRVIKAESLTMYVDFLSFMQYYLTYDFTVVNVENLYWYALKPAHTFTKSCVKVYAIEKTVYKKSRNIVRDTEKMLNETQLRELGVTDDMAITRIVSVTDWFSQMNILTEYLLIAKQKLNAQYGINMQNPITDVFECIDNGEMLEWEGHLPTWNEISSSTHKTNYLFGMYMPVYTQLLLTCATVYIINNSNDIHILYWDTDSMKIDGDLAECKRLIDIINQAWTDGAIRLNGELFENLGTFDYEETYSFFCTIGCKRYLSAEYDKEKKAYNIVATISGLSKASKIYQSIFNQCNDFQKVVDTAFKLNTTFDTSAVEGLTTYYKNEGKLIDFLDGVYSGVILKKSEFEMSKVVGDTKCLQLSKYYHLVVQKFFKNNINTEKTIISAKLRLKFNKKTKKLTSYKQYFCNGEVIK